MSECSPPRKHRSNWREDETCKQSSSGHGSALPFLWLSLCTQLESCVGMTVEPRPHGTTSHRNIMEWSSCTMLWQCIGYLPRKSLNRMNTRTSSSGPKITTSFLDTSCGGGGCPFRERILNSSK